ncbi:hypothetical protein Q8791_26650 [Nocardiopsis sp. CT-R113]|uniref:Uncharacterized protein n=1 Tax=Nocardiopsis codii TaxID=3065942 RepID=A0ABU7KEZ4_9ACTN|nr:hypothetical protein [Nocardiopsis sp. CT-R113]MEE2040805.1 hypothetical protein [Nocardiopsis sp. CT-R113]
MAPHTSETIALRDRDQHAVPAAPDAPELVPRELVPHLRGLARALRERDAGPTARDGGDARG